MKTLKPFAPRRALLTLSILTICASFVAACGSTTLVVAPAIKCSRLIPQGWRTPVQGVVIASPDVGGLGVALDGQTGKLDEANGRTRDSIEITETCEAMQEEATKKLQRKSLWSRFFG